jgi:hypothetical protein
MIAADLWAERLRKKAEMRNLLRNMFKMRDYDWAI